MTISILHTSDLHRDRGNPTRQTEWLSDVFALSDRANRTEGEFLRWPHTTKLIWGAHRIIYIFTDATGGLSLYYDIALKDPLETATTGGAMFPTTTIMTKG